jgi:hypothetical protein
MKFSSSGMKSWRRSVTAKAFYSRDDMAVMPGAGCFWQLGSPTSLLKSLRSARVWVAACFFARIAMDTEFKEDESGSSAATMRQWTTPWRCWYSPTVIIATNGQKTAWDRSRADRSQEYRIPVYEERIVEVEHDNGMIRSIRLQDGSQVAINYLLAMRGDLYHNQLAESLGAKFSSQGEVDVDEHMLTSVTGLYAAGCVTAANCQMIIAAGQGASAAQAINHDLFEEDLRTHALRQYREMQLRYTKTEPEVVEGKDEC